MEWSADTEYALIILDESGSIISAFHAWVCGLARKNTSELDLTRAADMIDQVLSNSLYAFKVDRLRLHELEEAWVPIIAGKDVKAILTYRNCD